MVMLHEDMVLCPECGGRMHKVGFAKSGGKLGQQKRIQRYQCPKCGRKAVVKPLEDADVEVRHCFVCGGRMRKVGMAWSGRTLVQRYRCPSCGYYVLVAPPEGVSGGELE